jgi:hypothetical protein
MKTSTLLAACSTLLAASTSFAGSGGFIGENGGDFLNCEPASGSNFSGQFALDYVLTYDSHVGRAEDPAEASFDELTARTTRILETKAPELADSWKGYLALLQNSDPAQPRVWHAAGSGLADLKDEQLSRQIDANCKISKDGALVPNLNQMVRRSYYIDANGLKIFYDYDQRTFDDARVANPLQLSYLAVHEWLWDFVREPNANRWVNRLIHSKRVETMSRGDVRTYLMSYSVSTDEHGQIGHVGPQEAKLQHQAQEAEACDPTKRIAVPFPAEAGRFIVEPGKTVSFETTTKRLGDDWPQGICGVGVLYSHSLASGVDADVTVTVHRGGAPLPRSFHVGQGSFGQELLTGFCADEFCDEREGDLAFFFKPGEIGKQTWSIDVSVTGASRGSVEISYPYLVFYAKFH